MRSLKSKSRYFWDRNSTIGTALFLGLFLLNALLASPTIGWYDSGEMVGVTSCLGISHPSGQGIYHLLGKIFLLLPWGTPAHHLALLSAACSALASLLFWVLSLRLSAQWGGWKGTEELPATLKTGLLLLTLAWSLSLPWWGISLDAEVYSLHLAFGLAVLWALSLSRASKWPFVFFLVGMSTVFRPTQCFVLPLLAVAFVFERKGHWKDIPKLLSLALCAFFLGRSTLLYLPLRSALHPAIAYAELVHPLAVLRHVLGLGFSRFVGTASLGSVLLALGQMASRFWSDLTPLGVTLSVGGLWSLGTAPRKVPVFLWVGLAWGAMEAFLILAIPYPAFESHQMLLSWAGMGLLAVIPLVIFQRWNRDETRSWVVLGLLGLFLVIQGTSVTILLSRQKERGAEDFARNVLEMMEPGALYIPSEENEYFPVVGFQQAFSFRKDIEVVEPGKGLESFGPKVREGLTRGRPVYVTRPWEGLPTGWRFQSLGPLLRITPGMEWETTPRVPGPPALAAWGGIELVGLTLDPPVVSPGGRVEITYEWARTGPSPQDGAQWATALFTDGEGNTFFKNGILWLHDIHRLFGGDLPFSSMRSGRVYREKETILVPSDYPPGDFRFMLALQKQNPPRQYERRAPAGGFYEETGRQDLEKFSARVEGGNFLRFGALGEGDLADHFWPVDHSTLRSFGLYFATIVKMRVLPRNETDQR